MVRELEGTTGEERGQIKKALNLFDEMHVGGTSELAATLEQMTGLESRLTILGHVQRGGTPSPADRLLATRLGTAAASFIDEGIHGVLVAAQGEDVVPVPLHEVAGKVKSVPLDHGWISSARSLGIALGE